MKRFVSLTALMLLFSIAGFADIARPGNQSTRVPKPKTSIDATMMIQLKSDAKEARLVIPKSQLKQLRAELDQLDGDSNTAAATASGITRTQTIVSGFFLSLAMVFGGMWFVRSGKNATKAVKTLAILTIVAGIGSAATFVFANAGPPPEARSITGKMFSPVVHMYKFGSGRVKLETSEDGDTIQLIVPDPQPTPKPDE